MQMGEKNEFQEEVAGFLHPLRFLLCWPLKLFVAKREQAFHIVASCFELHGLRESDSPE